MSHTNEETRPFHQLPIGERRRLIADYLGESLSDITSTLDQGGIDPLIADKLVENVLGIYALPFGVARHFVINGIERWVPMVVEEPSVIAAASNAAQRAGQGGGFRAETREDLMTAQIQLQGVADPALAEQRLLAESAALLALAQAQVPGLMARGGGPRALQVRDLGEGFLVVHLHVDCLDAMGANLVNTIAEGIGPRVAAIAGGTLGLRILTNLSDKRRVFVECTIPWQGLIKRKSERASSSNAPRSTDDDARDPKAHAALTRAQREEAERVAEAIENASRFAERDPYRATTHNKGIMNGIDSVVIATGNDYRAVEAGAHAFAARSGAYRPLATWRRQGDGLYGCMELPLALGIVGGTLRVHPTAQLALRLMRVSSASELAQIAAAAGLASNFAALRALCTDGIQKGHMALHARGVATLAGAKGDEVEHVATALMKGRRVNVESAGVLLEQLRSCSGVR
ncbi:MAG TPA: hydroxymethylglutaryl-CoA reductase [Polyangiaceae bacterium]